MKREIKYKAKRLDGKGWVYGSLVNNMWTYSGNSKHKKGSIVCEIITGDYKSDNWTEAIEEDTNLYSVIPETVCQLVTKIGDVEIYEGCTVQKDYTDGDGFYTIGEVYFCEDLFCWMVGDGEVLSDYTDEMKDEERKDNIRIINN